MDMYKDDMLIDLIHSTSLEELNKKINMYVSDGFTLEECINEILEHFFYNYALFEQYIVDIILNGEDYKRDLIFKNIDLTNYARELLIMDDIEEYVKDNFESVFSKLSFETRDDFLKHVLFEEDGIEFFKDQIDKFDLMSMLKPNTKYFVLNRLLKTEEGLQFVSDHLEIFLVDGINFQYINKMLNEGVSEESIIKHKKEILDGLDEDAYVTFIKWLKDHGAIEDGEISLDDIIKKIYPKIDDKEALQTIKTFYKELIKGQQERQQERQQEGKPKISATDIEYLGSGRFSSAYGIGDFVVKVGQCRKTGFLQYNRRILQPLLRQEITGEFNYSDGDTFENECAGIFVEVQNKVDTKWYEDLSDEEIFKALYEIYKDFRKDGIVWTDIFEKNVGRLLRRNTTNFPIQTLTGKIKTENNGSGKVTNPEELKVETVEMVVSDEATGIANRIDEPPLEQGELVVLDADYMFPISQIDIEGDREEYPGFKYLQFEDLYLREKEKEEQDGKEK